MYCITIKITYSSTSSLYVRVLRKRSGCWVFGYGFYRSSFSNPKTVVHCKARWMLSTITNVQIGVIVVIIHIKVMPASVCCRTHIYSTSKSTLRIVTYDCCTIYSCGWVSIIVTACHLSRPGKCLIGCTIWLPNSSSGWCRHSFFVCPRSCIVSNNYIFKVASWISWVITILISHNIEVITRTNNISYILIWKFVGISFLSSSVCNGSNSSWFAYKACSIPAFYCHCPATTIVCHVAIDLKRGVSTISIRINVIYPISIVSEFFKSIAAPRVDTVLVF
jgi:hypothetical protein